MSLRPFLALALLLAAASPALGQATEPTPEVERPVTDPPGRADPTRGYRDVGGGAEPVGVNATYGGDPDGSFVEESRDDERASSWLPAGVIFLFLIAITMALLFMRAATRRRR